MRAQLEGLLTRSGPGTPFDLGALVRRTGGRLAEQWGGALALAGVMALLLAAIAALWLVLPVWLAALIVGAVICAGGFGFISAGLIGLRRIQLRPEQTVETLNADVAWAKEQVR